MPNTLAHIGLQSLASRALVRGADLKWVYLASIVPDVPWIARRVVERLVMPVFPALSPYDLMSYATVQSSLLLSWVLAGALAGFSIRPRRAFAILALGALLHLLLDPLQTKWANGVLLFAPFSWELLDFGLFWPEGMPSVALTALGLGYALWAWRHVPAAPRGLAMPRGRVLAFGGLCAVAYLALPLALMGGPEAADNYSVRTLRQVAARPGRAVAFDRARFEPAPGGGTLTTFAGEAVRLVGPAVPGTAGTVSIRGRFLDRRTVFVEAAHVHWPWARDLASYLGLGLILLVWLRRPGVGAGRGEGVP